MTKMRGFIVALVVVVIFETIALAWPWWQRPCQSSMISMTRGASGPLIVRCVEPQEEADD